MGAAVFAAVLAALKKEDVAVVGGVGAAGTGADDAGGERSAGAEARVIVRYEPWGAWVKLETEAAIVALDRDGVRALGLDGGHAWRDARRRARPSRCTSP